MPSKISFRLFPLLFKIKMTRISVVSFYLGYLCNVKNYEFWKKFPIVVCTWSPKFSIAGIIEIFLTIAERGPLRFVILPYFTNLWHFFSPKSITKYFFISFIPLYIFITIHVFMYQICLVNNQYNIFKLNL